MNVNSEFKCLEHNVWLFCAREMFCLQYSPLFVQLYIEWCIGWKCGGGVSRWQPSPSKPSKTRHSCLEGWCEGVGVDLSTLCTKQRWNAFQLVTANTQLTVIGPCTQRVKPFRANPTNTPSSDSSFLRLSLWTGLCLYCRASYAMLSGSKHVPLSFPWNVT